MQLVQNMVHWWAFVNTIMKLLVPSRGVSSPAERLSASKEIHYSAELVTESAAVSSTKRRFLFPQHDDTET
jgi:hypothetical protein